MHVIARKSRSDYEAISFGLTEEFTACNRGLPRRAKALLAMTHFPLSLLLCLCFVFGCSTTTEPLSDHTALDIQNYFAPQNSSSRYLWKHSDTSKNTSLSYFQYSGASADTTIDGYSPISIYGYSDTARLKNEFMQFYISDKRVVSYGSSAKSLSNRMLLLSDTLSIGRSWVASDSLLLPDNSRAKIVATIDNYFTSIITANKEYFDVYRITYETVSTSKAAPTLPEYQTGGRIVRYFAKDIGLVLEAAYAPETWMVWANELVAVRSN